MDLSSILKLTLIEEIAVAFFDLQSPTDVNQHFKQERGGVKGVEIALLDPMGALMMYVAGYF